MNTTLESTKPIIPSLLICLALQAGAAEYLISITPQWKMDPDYLEVQAGDMVTWNNGGGYWHTITCQEEWDSGPLQDGQTFSFTFNRAGKFDYLCTDCNSCQGTIVVKPASTTTPPPPVLTSPTCATGGGFQFTVTNLVSGKHFIISMSTNLVDWTGVLTNTAPGNSYTHIDSDVAVNAPRFYRVEALP